MPRLGELVTKRVVIIGGRTGGAACATRLRRLDESADITLVERAASPSFDACGLPFSLGACSLPAPGDPQRSCAQAGLSLEAWRQRFRIDVLTSTETLRIDRDRKEVDVRNVETGETKVLAYDLLVLSPGAVPLPLPVKGESLPGVFVLTAPDALERLAAWLKEHPDEVHNAVVVGGGGLGLSMAERLVDRGLPTSIVDGCLQILPAMLDREMAALIESALVARGLTLRLGSHLAGIRTGTQQRQGLLVDLSEPAIQPIAAALVVLSMGTSPNVELARSAGLELSPSGAVRVDGQLKTSDPNIFAVGDVAAAPTRFSEREERLTLAGAVDRQAHCLAGILCDRDVSYVGALRTSLIQTFGAAASRVGLSEREARALGIAHRVAWYLDPGGQPDGGLIALKVVFSSEDGRVLGGQVVGQTNPSGSVERRIDVLATALAGRMNVYDLEMLELAYAPTSESATSARDAINQLGSIAVGILRGDHPAIGWDELPAARQSGAFLIDVRSEAEFAAGAIPGAVNIPLDALRQRIGEVPLTRRIAIYCRTGKRGYLATRILLQKGFDVVNLLGGYLMWQAAGSAVGLE